MEQKPPTLTVVREDEERSEDDGMPEHPLKADDPVAWDAERADREQDPKPHHKAFYRLKAALADPALSDLGRRMVKRPSAATLVGAAAGVAIYFLFIRRRPRRSYWQ